MKALMYLCYIISALFIFLSVKIRHDTNVEIDRILSRCMLYYGSM